MEPARMMRRQERAVGRGAIDDILRRARVLHLGLIDRGRPYVVPLNFGYESGVIYLHCAGAGRKLEALRRDPRVCFQVDIDHELIRADEACRWGMKYRSVIGEGRVSELVDPAERRAALDTIMRHYGAPPRPDAPEPFAYAESAFARVVLMKIEIESLSGKQAGY